LVFHEFMDNFNPKIAYKIAILRYYNNLMIFIQFQIIYQQCSTLNGNYALCYGNRASIGAHHKNVKEDRHALRAEM